MKYSLKLFVEDQTTRSKQAVDNVIRFCEEHLPNNYDLEIIDIIKNPKISEKYHVFNTPTLVKESPEPSQKLAGDLFDYEKLLMAFFTIDPDVP